MKTEIKEIQQQKKFKPFELSLTIESKEELETLWLVANSLQVPEVVASMRKVNHDSSVSFDSFERHIFTTDVFYKLNAKVRELK